MVSELKSNNNSVLRAAERVRAKRAAEATGELTPIIPVKTTAQVRARLNFIPDDSTLASLINQALTAMARGVRWARGSIINLIV